MYMYSSRINSQTINIIRVSTAGPGLPTAPSRPEGPGGP